MTRTALLPALLAGALLAGCTIIDVRTDPARTGVRSDALIEGYATVGWAQDPSFLEIQVFGGRSPGSLLMIELWYLARFELGLLGFAVGVGPLDFGIGTFFYHPTSPAAPRQRELIDRRRYEERDAEGAARRREAEEAEAGLDETLAEPAPQS